MYKNGVKFIIIILIFLTPFTNVSANNGICYEVSGAGTSDANGFYANTSSDIGGFPAYYSEFGILSQNWNGGGYYELKPITDFSTNGWYYDSAGSGGSYVGIDSINAQGDSPVPTIVDASDDPLCIAEEAGVTVNIDLEPIESMILVFLWIGVFMFTVWTIKKLL